MQSPSPLKVGIVGAGYVSAYHLRALKSLGQVTVVGIADTSAERAQELAKRFEVPAVYASLTELLAARPDVVHVLTPPQSHRALTVEALEAGCHVFVEKPMATTAAECDDMIRAAQKAGRVLSINHSAKADPVVERGLELVRSGAIGDVLSVDFHRSSDYPPYAGGPVPATYRLGGYPFEDIGIHGLYLLEAFLGRIDDVDVRYRATGRSDDVHFDDWRATVSCEKGIGHMFLSWATRPVRNELFVHGTRGFLHIDCFLQTCTLHRSLPGPKAITASIDGAVTALTTLYKVPLNMLRFATGRLRPSPGINAGVLQFYDALSRGVAPPVSMEEGRRMVAWVEEPCRRADADKDRAFRAGAPLDTADILVTGASGFLGRALLDRLRHDGHQVRVLVRRPSAALESMPGVQVVYGDLGDPAAVDRAISGVRRVYHVGATMRGRGWPSFEAGTVHGTRNVVDSCLRHGVERLVYVSSMTVLDYAGVAPRTVVTENAQLEPYPDSRGAYTKSKLQAETIVLDAVRQRGLPAVIIRPGQIFGPGAESIPPYGTIALAGRWIVVGNGTLRCPLVFVDDVVDSLLAAAARPGVVGSIFHVVDSKAVTQSEYIDSCLKVLPKPPRVVKVPRAVLFAAGAALAVVGKVLKRGVPLSPYRVRSINELRFDCSAAEASLGWRPGAGVTGATDAAAKRSRLLVDAHDQGV